MTVPDWLAPAIVAVTERAGGTVVRPAGGLLAVVTARSAGEFDVVLELAADAATLQVWGLERRYALAPASPETARDAALEAPAAAPVDPDEAALALVADWVAMLDGTARLAVYRERGVASCWTLLVAGAPWHPRRPLPRLVRWLRRWRRVTHANGHLARDASAALLADLRATVRPAARPAVAASESVIRAA